VPEADSWGHKGVREGDDLRWVMTSGGHRSAAAGGGAREHAAIGLDARLGRMWQCKNKRNQRLKGELVDLAHRLRLRNWARPSGRGEKA
jgi:hypothetical protein